MSKVALEEYFCRMEIESFLKAPRDRLDPLPQDGWTETAARGKIPHDVICTFTLLWVHRTIAGAGKSWSPTAFFGKASPVMCARRDDPLSLVTAT